MLAAVAGCCADVVLGYQEYFPSKNMKRIELSKIDDRNMDIAQVYNSVIAKVAPVGRILAVGDSNREHAILNMKYFQDNKDKIQSIGININKEHCGQFRHFSIEYCDAHKMTFADEHFDCVISVMMLEHDPEFWLSVAEMKRVLKTKGSLIVAVPGYINDSTTNLTSRKFHLGNGTTVYESHGDPDCYRFGLHFFEYYLLRDMHDTAVFHSKLPPRLIGIGYKSSNA